MNFQGRLSGRTAIVTGAARGLGAEFAKALASEGAAVVLGDVLDAAPIAQIINTAGGKAFAIAVDVSNQSSVKNMIAETVGKFGSLDILINNAGLFAEIALKRFEEIDSDEWDKVMAVNVRGVFECTKAAVPEMRKRKYGKIVNMGSTTAFSGAPGRLHYIASKGAIAAMTRCLARELGDDGIRVNTLAPGRVMTDVIRNHPDRKGADNQRHAASRAIKRDINPEDLCGTMIYLCSQESDFVTGQVIVVDGGLIMR